MNKIEFQREVIIYLSNYIIYEINILIHLFFKIIQTKE